MYSLLQLLGLVRVVEDGRVLVAPPSTLSRNGQRRQRCQRKSGVRHAQIVARTRRPEADSVHLKVRVRRRHLSVKENDNCSYPLYGMTKVSAFVSRCDCLCISHVVCLFVYLFVCLFVCVSVSLFVVLFEFSRVLPDRSIVLKLS